MEPLGAPDPLVFVVMGVAGCGKSSVGTALARALGAPFLEGDELHPPENIAKMRSGIPLTDEDRWPWLHRIRERIAKALEFGDRLVVSCSALKPVYRNLLRWGAPDPHSTAARSCTSTAAPSTGITAAAATPSSPGASRVAYILLQPSEADLRRRLAARAAAGGHFMPPSLLGSQLAALEVQPEEMWAVVEPRQRRQQQGAGHGAAAAVAGEVTPADGPQCQELVFPAAEDIATELAARLQHP